MSGHLVVVAHEATRTGSPRVLLDLLRYARPHLGLGIDVRLLSGGPLSSDLLAAGGPAPAGGSEPVAVVVNGVLGAAELWRHPEQLPTLVYVHEEGETLTVLDDATVTALTGRADRVLCVSQRSRDGLVELGVPAERIGILPPVVAVRARPDAAVVDEVRRRLGASSRPLVLGCGDAGWRKGADLFVQVAARLADEVVVAWVGHRGRAFGRILDHDTRSSGVADRLRWVDEVADPLPYLAAADVVAMTSRDDPQPLVPLEAGFMGTPTVGFAVGGLVEYAAAGAARTVEYPDVAAFAASVTDLLRHPEVGDDVARAAAVRASGQQAIDVVGPRFLAEVQALLDGSPS